MGSSFVKLPDHARQRVKKMAEQLGGSDDETVERLSKAWLEKMDAFAEKMRIFGMVEVPELGKDEPRGALVMTYSGSILLLGPPKEGSRVATYSSVGSRTGVPSVAEHDKAILLNDIHINRPVEFHPGPVARTSEVYKIGVCRTHMSIDEQSAKLSAVAGELTGEFAELNQTFIGDYE